jgi:hypothetical protein
MAYILSELYESWPKKLDLSAEIVRASTGQPVEDEEEFFNDLVAWLERESYIRFEGLPDGVAYGASLTEKGQALLIAKAPAEQKTFGERMKEEVKGLAKEGVTTAKSEIIAQLVGALIGSAAKHLFVS